MLAVRINFIAGKYHATPWDKQVNEGAIEWPPSPWRFLRALIAVWYQKGQDIIKQEEFISLLDKLSALPDYLLPPATLAHTRHFMPIGEIKDGRENTALVLDAFAAVPEGKPLVVYWNAIELDARETRALGQLLAGLSYFGRAESQADARLADEQELVKIDGDASYSRAYPAAELPVDGKHELIRLLACMGEKEYDTWKSENAGKFVKTGLPENTFGAMKVQVSDMKDEGWDKPPASKWARYARKKQVLNVLSDLTPFSRTTKPTVARYAIASAVQPNLKHALSLAERIHQSLVKLSNEELVFTGCDEERRPLEGHQHAYIFCESTDAPSRSRKTVNYVTVYAQMGFNENAERALRGIEKVWGHGGHDIRLMLLAVGDKKTFDGVPLFSKSLRWKSSTPFVPTRYPKFTRAGKPKIDTISGLQIGSPEHDLSRLLSADGHIAAKVKCRPLGLADRSLMGFSLQRKTGGGQRAGNTGYSCELEFNEPRQGPIAVGYGNHFGLGLFLPIKN
ncbi:type I-U CRISPR-associated protein Cas5/Cas6 [Candidatus Micrarchaeota archaeon]|nr:type I-U CRISPR-associated protein Cas5/Cas6 [Candidatus Micrarchaeota archaeon]